MCTYTHDIMYMCLHTTYSYTVLQGVLSAQMKILYRYESTFKGSKFKIEILVFIFYCKGLYLICVVVIIYMTMWC